MEFITKNLKKVGIVNTILIVAVLVARCITFANSPAISKVESIIGAIGLVFGFIYAFNGYKKDDAKYYKLFMYTYAINGIFAVISPIINSNMHPTFLTKVSNVVILICVCLLAFVKDLGKTKSFTAIGITLIANIIRFVKTISIGVAHVITISSVNLALAIIAFIFVVCKYADKESRGTK